MIDESALRHFLVRMGFVQSPTVMEPGDYAVRGGIIDIYPPGDLGPVRLDLFGDVLDGARRFDPATQRTTEKLDVIELAPVSEVILDEAAVTRFRQNPIAWNLGRRAPMIRCMRRSVPGANIRVPNIGWRSFTTALRRCLTMYRAPRSVWTIKSRRRGWPAGTALLINMKPADWRWRIQDPRWTACTNPRHPTDCIWTIRHGTQARLTCAFLRVVQFSALPQATGLKVTDAGGRIGRNFAPERQQESISLFGALASHIKAKMNDGPVVVASYSEGARERLDGPDRGRKHRRGDPDHQRHTHRQTRLAFGGLGAGSRVRSARFNSHFRTGRVGRPPDPRPTPQTARRELS